MAIHPLWTDDYWPLVAELYLKAPVGVKSEYTRAVVDMALEVHVSPHAIVEQMQALEANATPSLQRIWNTYTDNPQRLKRDVKRLRQMAGFAQLDTFFGSDAAEPFEHDYRPVCPQSKLTPVMLTIILQLYFQLTTNTMVRETPEVKDTARLLALKPEEVVDVLKVFQTFDPILKREPLAPSPLTDEAQRIWQKYANEPQEVLAEKVEKLKEYYS